MFTIWARNFINLIYPLACLKCQVRLSPLSDKPLCEQCWNKIEFNAAKQGLAFTGKDRRKAPYFFNRACFVCLYQGIMKECIHLFKYKAKLSLAGPLSKLMSAFAQDSLDMENIDLILPVPLHRQKLRQRQFNQTRILAEGLSRKFSKEIGDKLLVKVKATPAQVSLSGAQRLRNVRGSFHIKDTRAVKEKNILLIDDVLTTGATVNECARILKKAGAGRVDVLTLAGGRDGG